MKIELTTDNKFIRVSGLSLLDNNRLHEHFTKKVSNWFVIKKKSPYANVEESFINNQNMIPVGLWKELISFAQSEEHEIEIPADFKERMFNTSLTLEDFKDYTSKLFRGSKITPFEYQDEAVFSLLYYKRGCIDLSTSGGKTLISYMLFRYLFDHGIEHILMFVPNITLVEQTAARFEEYEGTLLEENRRSWTAGLYGGGNKEPKELPNLILGTFQTLTKKSKKWYEFIGCVIGDEIQHITAKSVQSIYLKSVNAEYKFGLTGTLHSKKDINDFTTQAFVGPEAYDLSSYRLIHEEKRATPIIVVTKQITYKDNPEIKLLYEFRRDKPKEDIEFSNKIYNRERQFIRDYVPRLSLICSDVARTNHNALILFADVKHEYGKRIVRHLEGMSKKRVFYVDGMTPTEDRDFYIEEMENDTTGNTVMVATMGTFSEGIDIKNLWYIYIVEGLKSERILAQALGRGMRRYEGKEFVVFVDYQDNLNYGPSDEKGYQSYSMKHAYVRNAIYKDRKFPIKKVKSKEI